MGIESYAAEVKVPLIFDNRLSFFLHYCYYYYCYNYLSWVKRFPSIQISECNRLGNLAFFSRVSGMPVYGMVPPNRI